MSRVRSNDKRQKAIFYVYALYRERKQKPFYIGKGHGYRAEEHFTEKNLRGNTRKNNIIKKDLADGKRIRIKILADSLTEAQALKLECEWIAYYGREVDGTGCLANMTLGGDGASGYIHSDAARARLSELAKQQFQDPRQRDLRSVALKNTWKDPHRRASHALMMEDASKAAKRREALSESNRQRWNDPSKRAALTAKLNDPVRRRAHSAAIKGHWQDPKFKKAVAGKIKESWENPDRRKAFSDFAKQRWQDPVYRKHMADCRAAAKKRKEQ